MPDNKNFPTGDTCPQCGAAVTINLDTDVMTCANGHTVEAASPSRAPVPYEEPEPVPTPPEPPPSTDPPAVEPDELPTEVGAPPSEETPAVEGGTIEGIVDADVAETPVPAAVETPSPFAAAPGGMAFQPEAEPETPEEGAEYEMEGGDILLVIRIPADHVTTLRNRAAETHKEFYTYFSEQFIQGLEFGWWQ